jgi:hypothetical protein
MYDNNSLQLLNERPSKNSGRLLQAPRMSVLPYQPKIPFTRSPSVLTHSFLYMNDDLCNVVMQQLQQH